MEHIFEKHSNCQKDNCPVCDGGLAICVVCKGTEGSLTTECPGIPINGDDQDRIYAGTLDYINGEWVHKGVKNDI